MEQPDGEQSSPPDSRPVSGFDTLKYGAGLERVTLTVISSNIFNSVKLFLKYLIVAFQLAMMGCAVKIKVNEEPIQNTLSRQNVSICLDASLPNRGKAYSILRDTTKFQNVNYDCLNETSLRLTRFDFGVRPITAHCGAQLLTTLSFGLIPSMCDLNLGGTFCLAGKTKEACFGPTYFQAEAMQGFIALPVLLFGDWMSVDNAQVVAAKNMIEVNWDHVAPLSK